MQDAVRRRLQVRPIELDDDDLARVDAMAYSSQSAVIAAVDALPAAERDAVRARIIDELDYHQLARELKCSESVVRQRVSRGLARVRDRVLESQKEDGT